MNYLQLDGTERIPSCKMELMNGILFQFVGLNGMGLN